MSQQTPQTPNTETLTRVQILTAMGVTAVMLLIVSRLWLLFDPTEMLPLAWAEGRSLLIGVALGLGITAASAIAYRVWAAYRQSADFYLAMVIKPLNWIDLIWLGLLPGMSERATVSRGNAACNRLDLVRHSRLQRLLRRHAL